MAATARRSTARNTVVFSVATGLSRVVGLLREVVASAYFGTQGAFSAFTLAFQVPNLLRALFADAALGAAFVPVFTELLEHGRRRDAAKLASTLLVVILGGLGTVSALAVIFAGPIMRLFTGDQFTPELDRLTVGLSQVMFPIVVLLGVNGLLVGILNAHDRFGIQAISPVVWNLVIIGFLVGGRHLFRGGEQLYAYAIGVLVGTIVQLLMAVPILRELDVGLHLRHGIDLRDPRVGQVLKLMLPVTIGLGLINFNQTIDSLLGSSVSQATPRAIDAAFRIYMLPQGVFSVAIATVLFPALSRLAARGDRDGLRDQITSGLRLILLLLVPAAAVTLVLATPITQLLYQRGKFTSASTDLVAEALFWFSFSLPFNGVSLLLTRTFFSLQRPWVPTALAVASLVVNTGVSVALYRPLGIAGIVIGTVAGTLTTAVSLAVALRRELEGRLDLGPTVAAALRITAASALLGVVAYAVHRALAALLGASLPAQLVAVGVALAVGTATYAAAISVARVPEALALRRTLTERVRGRRSDS